MDKDMNAKPEVILLVGVPASGKSWTAESVADHFDCFRHDDFIGKPEGAYLEAISARARAGGKPVLCETPFSMSKIQAGLEALGVKAKPVFVTAPEGLLQGRWDARGNVAEAARRGHLNRQATYLGRANEMGAFVGTSAEVSKYLTTLAGARAAQKKRTR